MKIYCLYGVGKDTERGYYYRRNDGRRDLRRTVGTAASVLTETVLQKLQAMQDITDQPSFREALSQLYSVATLAQAQFSLENETEIFPPFLIDNTANNLEENLEFGVQQGDGDGTVPLLSLGYMCVQGWKAKHLNPSELEVITREYQHLPTSMLEDLRGGPTTADHVDIMGNTALTEDVLKILSGLEYEVTNRIHSKILEYSKTIQLP
jgi:phospholipid:diacylglycerol acyltransferase